MIPGTATVVRSADGTVTVEHADQWILVDGALLDEMTEHGPDPADGSPSYDPQSGVLVIDTAGEYRYQHRAVPSVEHPNCAIFERIGGDPS